MIKKKFSLFSSFSRIEKIFLLVFGVGFFFSLGGISWSYFKEHSQTHVAYGGTYREGVVANASDLIFNPVFVYGKRDQSVESDITNLVFSGLMKFDSKTGKIEDFLGTHTLSPDKKTYTFRLKDGLLWHDGTELTADDVVYTYRDIIKNPNFSNTSLKKAFETVEVKKISRLEVSFTLAYPYKFFLTNFTVGILPKHILEKVPVEEMKYAEFSSHPIGSGPFKYSSLKEVRPNVFKITLKAFRKSSLSDPKLDAIEFIIYPSRNALSLDSHNLDGIRPFPQKNKNLYFIDKNLSVKSFALPQYSALFFNLDKNIFSGEKGKKIRMGLQLATNKKALLDIVPGVRIDTPLLEIKENDWEYKYSPEKANGAFKDSGYYLPSKKPKTVIPEKSSEKWITNPVSSPEWIERGEKIEIGGIFPSKALSLKIFWKIEGEKERSEIFYYEKQNKKNDNEEWKTKFYRKEKFINKRGELRVVFFDKNKEYLKEDALSLYWEQEKDKISNNQVSNNKGKKNANTIEKTEKRNEKKESLKKVFDSSKKNDTNEDEIRETLDGDPLKMTLLTSSQPKYYAEVAQYLKNDWKKMGVNLEVKVLPLQEFYDAVSHREYDILLYGQNLGYNLDIYEFFHGSQIKKDNLSEYSSQQANVLIQEIRSSHVPEIREKKLQELREVLKRDIPAVFLFSPTYEYYFNSNIQGMEIKYIAFLRDRFSNADKWYIKKSRSFKEGYSWKNFPQWFQQKIVSFITFSL